MPSFSEIISSLYYLFTFKGTYLFVFLLVALHLTIKKVKNIEMRPKLLIRYYFGIFLLIIVSTSLFSITSGTIFFKNDYFADGLKVIYSYSHIFDNQQYENLNSAYATVDDDGMVLDNPYSEVVSEKTNGIYHSHLPPIPSLQFHLTAYLIKIFNITHPWFIFINFILYFLLVFKNYTFCKISFNKNVANVFLALSLLSYPAIYLYQRGNFSSGYSTQLLIAAYLFFMRYKKLKSIHFLIIAIALNFRPNYIFLLPLFILDDGFINSMKLLIKHFLSFLTIGYLSFLTVNYMYKDYTFENILLAINRYREWHLRRGDGFENSVYRVFQQMVDPFNAYPYLIYYFFITSSLILISIYFLIKVEYKMYFLLFTVFLWSPVSDYHLLILIIPIIFHLVNFENYKYNTGLLILYFAILLPKPHFLNNPLIYEDISFIPISISNYFNASIFIYLLINPRLSIKN